MLFVLQVSILSEQIRKSHYVYIYDIIHKYETLNVKKVNS